MLPRKFHLSLLILSMFLFAGFTNSSHAEVESIQIHLFGFVNGDDARQIRRLLKPWANPEDVSFYAPVDKNGLKRHFTTIVEVTPRRGKNPYNEGRTFDIYDIIRQLSDQRFRGSQTGGRAWVTKSEATVTGNIYAHPGFSRSYIRNVPFWRRWRADTSEINHAMVVSPDQKVVFSGDDKFDELIQEANQGVNGVEVKGQIVGFDGVYPVISVRDFRVEYLVEPSMKEEANEAEETPKRELEYLKKAEDTDK
ncbi:hypothetical protein GBAR_LOCUS23299 [Geodia barretti]|uniref:Uncharacterized protein n=1 Tax=Geodia barretti TaxID=519541 RepID=A0AA35T539_GEOBA|nr:hypothetical protein GBAR_LOCUS23299 [Geodia barretti]